MKYELTVNGRSARFVVRDGERFDDALSRGAAKIGWRGMAWCQPNFETLHEVTVTKKPHTKGGARAFSKGICVKV